MTPNKPTVEEVVERLNIIISDFDAEVATEMASESGERADLWTDVDLPIGLVRSAASLITTLQAALDAATEVQNGATDYAWLADARAEAAEAERDALRTRVVVLEEVLKPFASIPIDVSMGDGAAAAWPTLGDMIPITAADVRRARAARALKGDG